ncbi:MAG: PIN domain-containing protein [Holophagales bacterium]|nr:PIN domain-containing protein [Holophagales bacterium]
MPAARTKRTKAGTVSRGRCRRSHPGVDAGPPGARGKSSTVSSWRSARAGSRAVEDLPRGGRAPAPPGPFDLAADLRVQHGLKTPDAIHAAAAIRHGCSEFWTNDQRLVVLESRLAVRRIA